jgi:hypothetical protein
MTSARRTGFLISAALHGFLAVLLMKPTAPQPRPPEMKSSLEVVQVDAADLADVTDQTFDFDVEKIISRGGRLFPFTQGELLHAQVTAQVQGGTTDRSALAFVVEPSLAQPPLALTHDQLQALLDKSWSRRHRWNAFKPVADAASHYHPDHGDLFQLLRGYVDDNSFQPFTVSSWNPEAKLWAGLSIAADHADFVEFILPFIARFPSTRSATELLLLLDNVVRSNLETLITLIKTDPLLHLGWTRQLNPRAAEALAALHSYYQTALGRRGLWRVEALTLRYDAVRLGILQHLVRTTPHQYRSNDAMFLLGEINWRHGKIADAAEWWQKIVPDSSDTHFAASSDIRRAITAEAVNRERIAAALDADKLRWIDASFIRLQQFGYRFDTF